MNEHFISRRLLVKAQSSPSLLSLSMVHANSLKSILQITTKLFGVKSSFATGGSVVLLGGVQHLLHRRVRHREPRLGRRALCTTTHNTTSQHHNIHHVKAGGRNT
jgi:hypothetical protein